MCCQSKKIRNRCSVSSHPPAVRFVIHLYFDFVLCFLSVTRPDSVGWETLKTVVLVVVHKSPSVFPSDRDVDWDKWESPTELLIHEAGMQWPSMAEVLTDFYPSTLKITGEKMVMDIPAEHAMFMVRHYIATSLSMLFSTCWGSKTTLEASGCRSTDVHGLGEHWGKRPLVSLKCSEEHSSNLDVVSPCLSVSSWLNHDKSCPICSIHCTL